MDSELQVVCYHLRGEAFALLWLLWSSVDTVLLNTVVHGLSMDMQVVSAPVIGKVAQVGIERVVGTVVGGLTGYAVYMLGSQVWNETTDGEGFSNLTETASCICAHHMCYPYAYASEAFSV